VPVFTLASIIPPAGDETRRRDALSFRNAWAVAKVPLTASMRRTQTFKAAKTPEIYSHPPKKNLETVRQFQPFMGHRPVP